MKERTEADRRREVLEEFKMKDWMFGRHVYPQVKRLIKAYSHLREDHTKLEEAKEVLTQQQEEVS